MTGDRTFAPTQRRRTAARREGQVAKSSELVAAGSALLAVVVLYYSGSKIVLALANQLKSSLTNAAAVPVTIDSATGSINQACLFIAMVVVPVLILIASVPVLMHWLQFGFLFAPNLARPRMNRLVNQNAAGQLTEAHTWLRGGLSLAKLTLVAGVVGFYLYQELPGLLRLMTMSTPILAVAIGRVIVRFSLVLAGVLLLPAMLDYLVARWQFTAGLYMTAEELREEQRLSGRS